MKIRFLCAVVAAFLIAEAAEAKLKVAASIPDLASIAASVGGERVAAFSIARAADDPHHIELLPSHMVKVAGADVYLKVGLGLDGWAAGIIDGSRNRRLTVVDCSEGIPVLEKPSGRVSAELGDVHPDGNPHYWLDPASGVIVAERLAEIFGRLQPDGAAEFSKNAATFRSEVERRLPIWREKAAAANGFPILPYHSSWTYFAAAFSFRIAGFIEPVPGIPPSGNHLGNLTGVIRRQGVKALLQEPYFPDDAPQFLSRETGVKVIKARPSCADAAAGSYFEHFDELLDKLGQASK